MVGYCSDSPAYLIYNTRTRHVLRSRSVVFDEDWLSHRDRSFPSPSLTSPPISGEDLLHNDGSGNRLTSPHIATTNDDIHMPEKGQPRVSGEQTQSPPRTRSATRRLATEENAMATHNAARAAVDNALNIPDPSQRQTSVLQLLGDAEEDREGLLQRLVTNASLLSTVSSSPTALVASNDEPSSFKRATSGDNCDQWLKAISSEYESHLVNKTWTLVEYP